MAEALVLSMIQKLQGGGDHEEERISCLSVWLPCFFAAVIKEKGEKEDDEVIFYLNPHLIEPLRMILDILRDEKLGNNGRRLNYFKCDLVDMAHDLYKLRGRYSVDDQISFIQSCIEGIKTRMFEVAVDGAVRSENVGEGDDEDVVGLREDVELLLRTWIIGEEEFCLTLLVKGMDGIGKTTLARQLYNHGAVVERFERRAWVCVSDLTRKEIFMELIQQVVDREEFQSDSLLEKIERADNRSLQQMLSQHLQGRRYFIVLDDVPKLFRLQTIMEALPYEGGTLLLTSHTTCWGMNYVDHVHHMEFMDSKKSWQLFVNTINCGDDFPKQLEKKGREMLMSKCSGLPLAIKVVGRQLAEKRQSGSDWELVLESVDMASTLELLEPFYQKLDPILKSCFLRLAFFKENTTMREPKLRQIWNVEGVVEDLFYARTCLENLNNESVIKFKDKSTRYHINAILHKLAVKKAKEEIGFDVLRNNEDDQPRLSPLRRVIICSREKFDYSTNNENKQLVSLFFHGGDYFDSSPSYWKSFELLKILDLEDFGLKILPQSIGILIELRYLGLRNNYIKELPMSLGFLEKLEILDIAQNFLVEVPDIIWEMGSLRHLYISEGIFLKPLMIDRMMNLETLTYISVDNWMYEFSGFQMHSGLRKLGTEGMDENSDVSKLFASIADMETLIHLSLRGFRFISMPSLDELSILNCVCTLKLDGLLAKLPSDFPPRVSYLTLANSRLAKDPMPVLKKLSYLIELDLRNAYIGEEMVITRRGFLVIEALRIEECCNLRNIQVEVCAMQSLKKLEIRNCPYLQTRSEEIWSKIS